MLPRDQWAGSHELLPDDVKALARAVLAHRLIPAPEADMTGRTAGDVIVHLFRPEVRSFYNLERMWSFGEAPRPVSEAVAH